MSLILGSLLSQGWTELWISVQRLAAGVKSSAENSGLPPPSARDLHSESPIAYSLKSSINWVYYILTLLFFVPLRGREEKGEEVKIVAVDLQAMAPLPGVTQIQGDITKVEII